MTRVSEAQQPTRRSKAPPVPHTHTLDGAVQQYTIWVNAYSQSIWWLDSARRMYGGSSELPPWKPPPNDIRLTSRTSVGSMAAPSLRNTPRRWVPKLALRGAVTGSRTDYTLGLISHGLIQQRVRVCARGMPPAARRYACVVASSGQRHNRAPEGRHATFPSHARCDSCVGCAWYQVSRGSGASGCAPKPVPDVSRTRGPLATLSQARAGRISIYGAMTSESSETTPTWFDCARAELSGLPTRRAFCSGTLRRSVRDRCRIRAATRCTVIAGAA